MTRFQSAGVVAVIGGFGALVWSGAGARLSQPSDGGPSPLAHVKAQRSGVAALKGPKNPMGHRIPMEQLIRKSALNLTAGPASSIAMTTEDTARRSNAAGRSAGRNVFVNDPCLDPPPTAPFPVNFLATVQSETDIAVLNSVRRRDRNDDGRDGDDDRRGGDDERRAGSGANSGRDRDEDDDDGGEVSSGRLMVAGYNDSRGFYDNREGNSGFSYSTDGGREWIDAGGLPPVVPSGAPEGAAGSDRYYGDPVVAVHHRAKTFFYASIYQNPAGIFTLSVNRGRFKVAPQQVPVESKANTRCEGNPLLFGVPDPPAFIRERIIWEPPVEAVAPIAQDDFLDKEWLYVDQKTGFLYMTYTRFGADGSTPVELVRSFDGGRTWTPPTVIIPNLIDTFNTSSQVVVTPNGRVVVTWFARTFPAPTFDEREQRIEAAVSNDGGTTFGPPIIVNRVNPQGEPRGYNRDRAQILNVPYLAVDKGRDDGVTTEEERRRPGFGNLYVTYFNGKTALAQAPNPATLGFASAADILLSTSNTNGTTWNRAVKVNDDTTNTSHVFSSVQVNELGEIFVTWIDRRVDPMANILSDTYGDISREAGRRLGADVRITDVSTDWFTREDAQPDFGDYNSSEVVDFRSFLSIWADGRFPPPAPLTPSPDGGVSRPVAKSATPDTLMAIVGRR